MSTSSKILLILGFGPNSGVKTAAKFASNGYKIAATSTHFENKKPAIDATTGYLQIPADLSNSASIKDIFAAVKDQYKAGPSVVVYSSVKFDFAPSKPQSFLGSQSIDAFASNVSQNITSVYAAATLLFTEGAGPRVFVYTGNKLNETLFNMPPLTGLAIAKAAAAKIIAAAALEGQDDITYYFTDERTPDGGVVGQDVNGDAAAATTWELVQHKGQGPWWWTFVKGEGYRKFPHFDA